MNKFITVSSILAASGIWIGVFYLFGLQGVAIASGVVLAALVLFFIGASR
jgi:hypothetical protein